MRKIRRNKISSIVFIAALLLQTVFTNLGMTIQVQAEGDDTSSILSDGVIIEGSGDEENKTTIVQFQWTLNESVEINQPYIAELPENTAVEGEQSGELTFEDSVVGSFLATEAGKVSVQFDDGIEGLEKEATGAFEVAVVVENEEIVTGEEVVEGEAALEADKNDGVDEENSETDADQESSKEKVDEEVSGEKEEISKETKVESRNIAPAAEEKHGFKLELDEITDTEGVAFDEQHPMDPHQEFILKLDWLLEDGHNYVAGDTETFDLPKGIKIKQDILIELRDDHGQIIAHAVVTPEKTVELTFTDFVEGHSAVSGWMEIISALDIQEVEEEDGNIIINPIGEEGELRIPIEKSNKDKTIEKNGQPNKGYNADEINWTVTINKNKTSLENARVIDALPEGTEYKEGSLKVTKLRVDLDGNILGDGEEVEVTPEVNENGELIVPLGDTNDAYRVEYVTTVTDDEKKIFENNATLKDDELNDVSAKSTITINRGEPIKKSAVTNYNPKTGIIEWEIEFNFNQKDLSDVTLTDAWTPEGILELVEDSLKFQEVSIDENGHAHHEGDAIDLPAGASLNVVDDGFEVSGISTDNAYKVTYQTKLKDRVLDPLDVSNTAGFGSEWDGSGTHIGQYYGAKSAGTIDYAEKTIEWTIRVNHDEYPMEDISIEDTLGDGLTLLEDTVNVTVGGESYEGYTLSGDNPFKIDFPEGYTTDKEILITYKTEFDADNVPDNKPTNKAAITWTPEGENDSITKEVEAGTELNKETADYSWKNGSYNPETKEITWEIITNYRENDLADLIVQDKPQGNQQIIDGSAEVKELNIAANGSYSDGDTVEGAATIDEEDNTLTVNLGETNKAYKITYKTSLEGLDDMQDEYVNEAKVLNGNELISEIDAKVGVVKNRKYGGKSGFQDGKQVHWSIDVNLVQQKINDLTLVDKISENQDYLEDSIKVYHANIDANGNASKRDEVSPVEYSLDINQESGEFTIQWENEVERAFIVEYSTLFFEKHNGTVENTYKITGDSIGEEENDASDSGTVTISQLGSGGGVGTAGYLVIDKVDTTYGEEETSLAGAEFDLIDTDTGNVLKSGITDENGQIDFGRLLFGDYTLVETTVPVGYVTPEEEQIITIDKAYIPGDDKESFEYTIENYQPVFAVELLKTDEDNNTLRGAEFSLFDLDDNKIQSQETDENGKILFEGLESAGNYYIQETKAPAGFVLDETKHEVTIDEKQHEPVQVTAENKARGAVQLTKTDVDTGEALKGVEFVLQKENNSGSYDTIETFTTDGNGQIVTSNTLEAGNYQFVETEGLDGYRTNGNPIKFTVNVNSTATQELTMTNEQYKGSVKLIKRDAATNDLLAGAEFTLVDENGEVVEENLTTNAQGEIIVGDLFLGNYQFIETKAPEGYELDETPINVEITEDNEVVETTKTNDKITNISVEKEWNNAGGDTEPVTVMLLPTEETVELNEENDWKATFEGLYVYDHSGEEIVYQVEELAVEGYNSSITGDASEGFIVTNTEVTSVSGEKRWLDDNSGDRPDSITVELLANNQKIDETDVTAQSDWEYSFVNLDKYDANGEEINYTIDEVAVSGYETTIDGFNIENLRVGTIAVEGEKTWKDEDPTDRPESIEVNLTREVNGEADEDFSITKTVEPTSQGNWSYVFEDLDEFNENGVKYTYIIEELNVPERYESEVTGHDITNVRVGKTEVSGTKRWKDDNVEDRPESITVNLLRNNVVIDQREVTAEDNWVYTFTDLDAYDEDGKYYKYTVKEEQVLGYAPEVSGYDITNTRSEKTSIDITKGWLDGDSEDRPESVIVYVYQNGELFDTVEVTADNDWEYELTDVDAYDEDGQPYTYTVKEKPIEGYEATVNGFNITNLRVGETEVSGEKTWKDNDDATGDRPDFITVNLLQNGEVVDSQEVTAEDNWEYSFKELDEFDKNGVTYSYTIDEEDVEGYAKSMEGNDLVNTRTGITEVSGEKIWRDNDNATGDRPDSIIVNLLQNGFHFASVVVTPDEDGHWEYSFTNLPEFDEEGIAYGYTVDEEPVEGYDKSADGNNLVNTRTGETEVAGTKTWMDNDDATGDRPEVIYVHLLQNGSLFAVAEVTAESDWEYSFEHLPAFDENGVAYVYTIDEEDVEGYAKSVDGNDLINTRVGETEVSGTKIWKDENGTDRPDSITVILLQNGSIFAKEVVTAEDNWEYSFNNLPAFDENGIAYGYTIDEEDVEGYAKSVDGNDLINTRVGETEVSGTKTWKDEDDSARPDSITVNLLQNGVVFAVEEVTADDNWEYSFTHLPKYDSEGKAYEYSISEHDVPGYASEVNGFDLTNTRTDEKTIEITKAWVDDQSTNRPESIEVELYRSIVDGEKELVGTYEVTEGGNWSLIIEGLPAFDENGIPYVYEINEIPVEGYETTINGFDITNTLKPGEPEKPEDPEEEKENNIVPTTPKDPEKPSDQGDGDTLPKTATQIFNLLMVGLFLAGSGLLLAFSQRRKA